jgi:hypothetical protein
MTYRGKRSCYRRIQTADGGIGKSAELVLLSIVIDLKKLSSDDILALK